MNDKPIIDPKNLPSWTAASFALTLIALSLALLSVFRLQHLTAVTQAQAVVLSQRINDMSKPQAAAPAPGTTANAGPAAPAQK